MKRAGKPNSAAKSRLSTTGDNVGEHHQKPARAQTEKPAQLPQQATLYCPTDEPDLTIHGDQQQVSLLNPRHEEEAAGVESQGQRQSVKGSAFSTFAANMIRGKKAPAAADNGDQAHQLQQQQGKKQSSGGKSKKNILNSSDHADEDLESSNTNSPNSSLTSKRLKWWTIFILMTLLVGLFIVVITLFVRKPDDTSLCPDIRQPFQASSYRLFSTKTAYLTALNYISPVPLAAIVTSTSPGTPTAAPLVSISPDAANNNADSLNNNNNVNINNNNNQHFTPPATSAVFQYDKSSIYKPSYFSPNETLETLHKRLSEPQQGCRAKQFNYFGRHAARFPSERQIERLTRALEAVKKRIDLIISPSSGAPELGAGQNASKPACFDPLLQFSNWPMFAKPNQGNLITATGAAEALSIASRFKNLYPHLFDGAKTKLSIGTSSKIRTAQTAVNFLKKVDNLPLDTLAICAPAEFASEDQAPETIDSDSCFKSLLKRHTLPELSFHKGRCAVLDEQVNFKLNRSALTEWITQAVSKRLKLDSQVGELTYEEMKTLHDLCKYETAISASSTSIWCSLFTEQQMKYLEYLDDLEDFKKVAYGNAKQATSSCLVTKNMITRFMGYVYDSSTRKEQLDHVSQFHFTHSQVIQKIIANSLYLDLDPAYRSYQAKLESHDVPKEREWQTSLLTPFAANLAFILYECHPSTNETPGAPQSADFVVGRGQLKLVTAINEQPVLMGGCEKFACPLDLFLGVARMAQDKKCSIDTICGVEDQDALPARTRDQSTETSDDDDF